MSSGDNESQPRSVARSVFDALGLVAVFHASPDVKLLCAQRFVRLFAYGTSTLVLVSLLRELHVSQSLIGLFMTLTLIGDVAISFLLAMFADGAGRRAVLALGAVMMTGSGIVFALADNYWVLLMAAILGVISPSGNEIGPFKAVEESIVSHLIEPAYRSDVFAWYSLSGPAGTAFGIMTCGWAMHYLHSNLGYELLHAYRLAFFAYAVMGVIKLVLILILSPAVELDAKPRRQGQTGERAPLLRNGDEDSETTKPKRSWLAQISKQSIPTVISLCILFALDSFASGLASLSWTTYFFRSRYGIEEGQLGSIFFVTSIIAAASMLVASSLAKRFGNINAMVFTHLPSAVFLALIPVPNEVHLSIMFLILRSCTQSMDVAPRSAFLAAILRPEERTVTLGLFNVSKTAAQSLGPLMTGVLADSNFFWVSFIMAGSLKICYDLGLLAVFKHHEREERARQQEEAERGEEEE